MPPALHPSGHIYVYENENGINVLPAEVHRAMIGEASSQARATDERLEDDDEVVAKGERHAWLARKVGALANVAISQAWLVEQALALNAQKCDPPKPEAEVKAMARAFWKDRKSKVATQMRIHDEEERDKPPRDAPPHVDGPTIINLDDVPMRSVMWLDRPWLQGAAFQIVAAKGSTGKGLWTALVAAQMTRGELPDDQRKRGVLFITSEDDPGIDLKPRLVAAGADVSMVGVLQMGFYLPEHTAWLRAMIREHGLGMVVIDPVSNHIAGVDSNDEAAVRHALAQLNVVAQEEECLILGVRHMRKDAGSGALAAVLGSTAWVDLPRNVIVMVRDPDDKSIVHQSVEKQNRAEMGEEGRVYKISGVEVDGVDGTIGKMTIDLLTDFRHPDSIVGKRGSSDAATAKRTMMAILSENGGDMLSDDLDAQVAGRVGCSTKTAKNARSDMTAGYKGKCSATDEKPLVVYREQQLDGNGKYHTKIEHIAIREDEGGEVEEF
jgi:hypothetical protein